jgi:hypothetical protein
MTMNDETPSHRRPAVQPTVCKTSFTGEDPETIHPERDPHLAAPSPTAAPVPAPVAAEEEAPAKRKKTPDSKE